MLTFYFCIIRGEILLQMQIRTPLRFEIWGSIVGDKAHY